jgi:FkbM family methyltransferase
MKLEEKIKYKYLYDKKLNILKFFYFLFQYLKMLLKFRNPNSHWGVDLILNSIFKNKRKGFYVDIGCHHPLINNHTYLFYKKGWSGVNIDIDFSSIDMFNFYRPKDINRQLALSDKVGEANLYFYHNRAAKNTLSKEFGADSKTIKNIKTDTLTNFLNQNNLSDKKIDFMSIDVEGNELKVLEGLDFKTIKPSVILVEFRIPNVKEFYQKNITDIISSPIYNFMISQNYKLINWNHDDLMFMRNETSL